MSTQTGEVHISVLGLPLVTYRRRQIENLNVVRNCPQKCLGFSFDCYQQSFLATGAQSATLHIGGSMRWLREKYTRATYTGLSAVAFLAVVLYKSGQTSMQDWVSVSDVFQTESGCPHWSGSHRPTTTPQVGNVGLCCNLISMFSFL